MDGLTVIAIRSLLAEVARRYRQPAQLFLLGGSALCLLGSPRATLDIDYVGDDLHSDALQQVIEQVAHELHLEVEAVPIEQFVPLSPDVALRHHFVERFDALEVYIFDPYTIALSKLDRGFDTDLDDVLFLLRQQTIELSQLIGTVDLALQRAVEFDLNRQQTLVNLELVRQSFAAA
jgi:hypothetical protein